MARRRKRSEPTFDPTLSEGVMAIILIILSAIITLGFFEKAGVVGTILDEYVLGFLFGVLKYVIPFVLLFKAWHLIREKGEQHSSLGKTVGGILLFLAIAGMVHMQYDTYDMWREALEGNGAGISGILAFPAKEFLGTLAGYIVFIGIALIAAFFIFERLFPLVISLLRRFFSTIGRAIISPFTRQKSSRGIDSFVDETYDDEDDEDEVSTQRSFRIKHIRNEQDDATDNEDGDDEEVDGEEEDDTPDTASGDVWSKRVIIKNLPPLDLLNVKRGKPTSGDIKGIGETIRNTLAEFGINVDMGEVRVGPTVTQYSFKPAKGVKLSRITTLSNDLALALAAHPIRIEAPIPGKALVGIEVPNQKTAMVTFRELLESKPFLSRPHNMMVALGKDVGGNVWFADLPRMPHLLVAGATGSGKTVCINTIIMSLIYQNTAETLRMIMVDPKRVELTLYNGIPHLLTPVITNTQQTINALKWTIGEMERRFELLSHAGSRDITSYNKKNPEHKIPHIVFIIDELADLMATAANEVEAGIIRLAQMARAVGIHLVVATQRPSVDVITGLMKANIPGRIAFSVASLVDSRTILDTPGAEKLLGRGDMLFQTAELSKPVRIQGSFISEEELKHVVEYLRGDEDPEYDESIVMQQKGGTMNLFGGPSDDLDPLFEDAKKEVVRSGKASASLLQRRLKVGYARAARIMDELEESGVIGPGSGAKAREILMTKDELHGTMSSSKKLNVFDAPSLDDESDDDEETDNDDVHSDEPDEELYDDDEEEVEEDTTYDDEEDPDTIRT